MTTTDLAPIGLRATPDGLLPCAVCGLPTSGPTTAYPVMSRLIATPGGERSDRMADGTAVDLPTCPDCEAIADTARAIVAANPGIVHALGGVATWRLTAALYGLSVLGHRLPGPDIAPARLGALIHRLAVPGALARYSCRFSPVWVADATTKFSARERWSAVLPDVLGDLRRGAVDWMGDGRPVRPLHHPQGSQCAWCGTATAPGRRTSEAWFGDLCVTCAWIKTDGGDWYAACWSAIDGDHAIRGGFAILPDLEGVRPWSKSGGGRGEPWGHLGGVDALRKHVAHIVGVSV